MSAIKNLVEWLSTQGTTKAVSETEYGQGKLDFYKDVSRKAREFMAEEEKEKTDGYWWCPECKEVVDPKQVTFTECHEICGRYVSRKKPLEEKPTQYCGAPADFLCNYLMGEKPTGDKCFGTCHLVKTLTEKIVQLKSTAPAGLVEELEEYCKPDPLSPTDRFNCTEDEKGYFDGVEKTKEVIMKILSHYKPEQSLAELADEKARIISRISGLNGNSGISLWQIQILNYNPPTPETKIFNGKTYAEAESKAREFLRGLK